MAASTTVNFNLKDAGYANYADQTVTFTLKNVGTDNDDTGSPVVARSSVSAKSDSNGDGSLTVFVTGDSNIGTSFDVTLPGGEHVEVVIPSSAADSSIELSTLLVSHQVSSTPVSETTYDAARNRDNHTGFDDLTSDVTGVLPIANGGTNSSTAAGARINLGLGSIATQDSDSVIISGGTITGVSVSSLSSALALADGGTGASTASGARTSLGLVIGTDVVAHSNVLDTLGALSNPTTDGEFIVANALGGFVYESGVTVRNSLGLGPGDTPIFGGLDLDGNELILDADGDTSITADTDNQIDIKVASADRVKITSSAVLPVTTDVIDLGSSSLKYNRLYVNGVATVGSLDVSEGNIINAGDINCDSISSDDAGTGLNIIFDGTDTGENKITLTDNLDNALDITEVGSGSYLKFTTTNAGEKIVASKDIEAAAVTGTDVLATDSLGYGAGNGGTETQATSKSTGVTLNAVSGEITMHNATLNHDTNVQFTLTNNQIAATDVVIVNVKDCVGPASEYIASITAVGSGSCEIMLRNVSNDNNNKSEAVVLSFAVIKAVTS